ncbi:hypothetical protein NP233_g875 [Leucocoprinus birnbaumii]|uniref:Uncharacterized protein n=1 Tax=Leucocoprinus birnbaumii TaxID=56174 RepID=A0AAD5YYD8_9AGAR|nr:hypothetical protein NP233_g875 [Leucocoprinus birnbaumii]
MSQEQPKKRVTNYIEDSSDLDHHANIFPKLAQLELTHLENWSMDECIRYFTLEEGKEPAFPELHTLTLSE